MSDGDFSRRDILRGVGAGVAATAVGTGTAAASEDESRGHVVGIEPDAGELLSRVKDRSTVDPNEIALGDRRTVVAGNFPEAVRSELRDLAGVAYVEDNITVEKYGQSTPWGVDRIDADKLQNGGKNGDGATVAVLDTGVDSDHPDLPTPVQGKCFMTGGNNEGDDDCCGSAETSILCQANGNQCNQPWDDDDDHGTHVSGTVAAVDNSRDVVGVGPKIDIMAGKVLGACGGTAAAVADGIRWAANNGADVINMSLGADSSSSAIKDACQYAADNNVVIVAAAGNDGECTDCVGYPAAYSTVIAVSSTNKSDGLSDFSSTGPEVEIAAPGSDVPSTVPPESSSDGMNTFSGTSMASPHVAGVAAQVKAETSLSDNSKIRDRLQSTAEDIGLASNESGNGLVDAEAAVGSGGGGGGGGGGSTLAHESGTVSFSQSDATSWTTVSTSSSYTDPVVVAGPPSYNGVDPATTRVRNVGSSGFDLQLDEWDYRDGSHISETFGYVVAEAGTGTVGGAPAEAGHVDVRHNFVSVSFSQSFSTRPVVIAQCTTYNGPQVVTTRLRDVTTNGFEVQLQEEEAANGRHYRERVDYLAIEPVNASGVEVGSKRVRNTPVPVSLDGFSTAPSLVASVQTWNGINPGSPRVKDLTASGFETFFDEEASADSEVQHIGERVGYVALD